MVVAISPENSPVRRRLARWIAVLVMALAGGLAAALVVILANGNLDWPDLDELAMFGLSGAFGAGATSWLIMGWAIARTEFGWGVALAVGAVTALLSYPMFGLALSLTFLSESHLWREGVVEPLRRAAGLIAVVSVAGPALSGHITLPLGAVGGVICHALSRSDRG